MRQHLALLVDNKPGVLTHVAGLISRRGINIEAINAGYTEDADITRINIIVEVKDHWELDQAVNQLAKLINVIKIVILDDKPFVSYDLALIKIRYITAKDRIELSNLAELFHAKIVDVDKHSLIFRLAGRVDHIDAMLILVQFYDFVEVARSGCFWVSGGEGAGKHMET